MFGRPMQLAVLIALGTTLASYSTAAAPGPKFQEVSTEPATALMAWHRGHRHWRHRRPHRHLRHRRVRYYYGAYPWAWCYRYIGWDRRRHKICSDLPYAWPY